MTEHEARQRYFNAAWNGLKSQGFLKSVFPGMPMWDHYEPGECAGDGEKGRHCAAAWALKMDKEAYIIATPDRFSLFCVKAHNYATSPSDMQSRLRAIAREYGLTVPGDAEWAEEMVRSVVKPIDAIALASLIEAPTVFPTTTERPYHD
jgi:hypothetical protein